MSNFTEPHIFILCLKPFSLSQDIIRTVLGNLKNLQPFSSTHFNIFPCILSVYSSHWPFNLSPSATAVLRPPCCLLVFHSWNSNCSIYFLLSTIQNTGQSKKLFAYLLNFFKVSYCTHCGIFFFILKLMLCFTRWSQRVDCTHDWGSGVRYDCQL